MTKKLLTIITLCSLFINLIVVPVGATGPPVLITEVQTGLIDSQGTEFPKQEFIELTNVSSAAVDMTGWKLEYLSAANDGSGPATQLIDTISGQIGSGGHGIWDHEGYYPAGPDSIFGFGDTSSSGFLAKSGGHVRLMNGTTMIDCVAWGSAVVINGCDKVSAAAPAGYTLQRKLIDGTYDKSLGVANLKPPTPQGGNIYSTAVVAPITPPPSNPPPTISQPTCDNILLNEILANPAGDDAAGEFIEIHNPTDQIQSLYGCVLKVGSRQYAFPDGIILGAHAYAAYNYATTGLQLSNSGSSVTLTTIAAEFTTTYPAVGDDESWSLIDGAWFITKVPTPNAENILSSDSTSSEAENVTLTEPCPIGKYRHPETNRCRNIEEAATTSTACATDQERNPATNRCRKIVTAVTPLTCPAGQERNSATNRCRKIEAPVATKTCPVGLERNTETNRCRKIVTSPGKVLGVSTLGKHRYHFVIVGAILLALGAYGVYEYRQELLPIWKRLRRKLTDNRFWGGGGV